LDGASRFEVENVYGYLGPLPITRRSRKMADGSVRQGEYRARRPLTAGAYLLKARKRVQDPHPGSPAPRVRQLVLVPAAEGTSKLGSSKLGSDDTGA